MSLNTNVFLKVNHFAQRTPSLHGLFQFVANFEIVFFAALLIVGWAIARKRSDIDAVTKSVWAGIGTVIAVGANQPLVSLFHEKRPYDTLSNILVLAHRSHDFSFPSDHTVMAGAVTAGLFLYNKTLGYISLVLALILAFARVYTAAHWPQDVVGGLILGTVVSLVGYTLLNKPLRATLEWLAKNTPLRVLIMSAPADNKV